MCLELKSVSLFKQSLIQCTNFDAVEFLKDFVHYFACETEVQEAILV